MRMNIGISKFYCFQKRNPQPATFFENWFLMLVVWVDTTKAGLLLVNLPLLYMLVRCLFPDAECKICKYKLLIIIVYNSYQGGQILCGGTEEGRKIYKNLQMKLPSKIKYTNICKDVFPVLCIFTFVNTDSCTFLYSL